MSIVCVYKLCSRRTPAFHACNKHTDLIGGCFLFPRKSSKKAAPEIRGFQTVEKANAFSTKGMPLDCAQAFRAKREKLTLAQRAVCFRSAKPPDNMDFHFISPCGAKLCEAFRHTESSPGNPGLLALLSECAVYIHAAQQIAVFCTKTRFLLRKKAPALRRGLGVRVIPLPLRCRRCAVRPAASA